MDNPNTNLGGESWQERNLDGENHGSNHVGEKQYAPGSWQERNLGNGSGQGTEDACSDDTVKSSHADEDWPIEFKGLSADDSAGTAERNTVLQRFSSDPDLMSLMRSLGDNDPRARERAVAGLGNSVKALIDILRAEPKYTPAALRASSVLRQIGTNRALNAVRQWESKANKAEQQRRMSSRLDAVLILFDREFGPKDLIIRSILTKMVARGRNYHEWMHDTPVLVSVNPEAENPTCYMAAAFVGFRVILEDRFNSKDIEVAPFLGTESVRGVVLSHWSESEEDPAGRNHHWMLVADGRSRLPNLQDQVPDSRNDSIVIAAVKPALASPQQEAPVARLSWLRIPKCLNRIALLLLGTGAAAAIGLQSWLPAVLSGLLALIIRVRSNQIGERYFEDPRPHSDGRCSDNECPCGAQGVQIRRGTGYLIITSEVVDRRKAARTQKLRNNRVSGPTNSPSDFTFEISFLPRPILCCDLSPKLNVYDKQIAAEDAAFWWKTGLIPLRPTPVLRW